MGVLQRPRCWSSRAGLAALAAEDPLFATLSARERQILAAVVAGQNNSEIGAAVLVGEKTVRNSLTRVFGKLGVRTRTQAAVLARDRGIFAIRTRVPVRHRSSLPTPRLLET